VDGWHSPVMTAGPQQPRSEAFIARRALTIQLWQLNFGGTIHYSGCRRRFGVASSHNTRLRMPSFSETVWKFS